MFDNCRKVSEDSSSITIETDLIEHNTLLEDVTKLFFTKNLGTRKFKKK